MTVIMKMFAGLPLFQKGPFWNASVPEAILLEQRNNGMGLSQFPPGRLLLPGGLSWERSCRREMLDHIIALNEAHLRRLISAYVKYYHEDRIHDALHKDTPHRRPAEPKPAGKASLVCMPRLGGLQHRYTWREAA